MAQLIGVCGGSGTGKSTGIRTLNPKETYIINVAKKPLPFKGSSSSYSEANKNYFETDKWEDIIKIIQGIPQKYPHIKNIVLEDAQYVMSFEYLSRSKETGYNKFTDVAKHMADILTAARALPNTIKFFYLTHAENVVSDGAIESMKFKTIGQMLDNTLTLEGLFTFVFYTHVEKDAKDINKKYTMITNQSGIYPAKTPMGCFDDIKIPNDFQYVCNKIDEYLV